MPDVHSDTLIQTLQKENAELKKKLSTAHKTRKPIRPRPGHRQTKTLRYLRLTRQLHDAIVTRLQGLEPEGVFVRRTGRKIPIRERVKELCDKYLFTLSKKNSTRNGKPFLNVRTRDPGARMFRVVPIEDTMKLIRSVYDHPGEGGYRGRDALYNLIRRTYVGVSRDDIERFLFKREFRQQLRPKQKKTSTAVLPKNKRGIWQIDFIQIKKQNNRYRYVCVIVDMYSKYLWAFPLRERAQGPTSQSKNRYNTVMHSIQDKDFIRKLRLVLESENNGPEIMQSDNEFRSKEYLALMKEKGIKVSYSLPYSPQTNGGVERVNGTLKKCLMQCMLRSNGRWIERNGRAGCLPLCVHSYNNIKHRSTGKSPVEVHRPNMYHQVERDMREREGLIDDEGDSFPGDRSTRPTDQQPERAVTRRLVSEARKRIEKDKQPPLVVGDLVRVRIIKNKPVDDKAKNKIQRLGGRPNWSEEIYVVQSNLGRNRYTVAKRGGNGEVLQTRRPYFQDGKRRQPARVVKFMRHQLLRIELPDLAEEPYDPDLNQRISKAMKTNMTPQGFSDDGSRAAMSRPYQTAAANQQRIQATRTYRLRNRQTNKRYNTRQSGNRLLRAYDDPEDHATLTAIRAHKASDPKDNNGRLRDEDKDRLAIEFRRLGLAYRKRGSDSLAVSRILAARQFNQLDTHQLRLRLATFALPGKKTEPKLVVFPTNGTRPQLLARVVLAYEGGTRTVPSLQKQTIKPLRTGQKNKADALKAFVQSEEANLLSDEVVEQLKTNKTFADRPDTQLNPRIVRRWLTDQTWNGTLRWSGFQVDTRSNRMSVVRPSVQKPTSLTPGGPTSRFQQYLRQMSRLGVWGGEPELQAAAECYRIQLVVHSKSYFKTNHQYTGRVYRPAAGQDPTRTIHLFHVSQSHYRLLEPCNNQSVSQQQTQPYDTSVTGKQFSQYLKTEHHLCEVETGAGGNCLFSCLSRGLGWGRSNHHKVRKDIVAYMRSNYQRFEQFAL